MQISPSQSRAARALLDMSREELAGAAKVALRTISDFESGRRAPIHATMTMIRQALEERGVIFIPENGDGPGVRLQKRLGAQNEA